MVIISVGDNIKKLRERKGKSQTELAEDIGIKPQTVSAWECGISQPRMGMVEKLASYFGVLKSELVEEELELFALNRDFTSLTPEEREFIKGQIKLLKAMRNSRENNK